MVHQVTQVAEDRVFDSDNKLRHLPYFEFIASRAEGDAEWRSATAGLLVLRQVDAWVEEGRSALGRDSWTVRNVRNEIETVEAGSPIRSLLDRVMDAMEQKGGTFQRVLTPLMAYGQALEYEAHWSLAADVYHTVLSHLDPASDTDSSIAAHLRLGQCFRNLNMLADAASAFDSASDVAAVSGDLVGVLRARIGHARLDIIRGNLPRAEQILDDAIRKAEGPALRDVRSRALHNRSNVAYHRGQYELAIQLAYQALSHSQSARERDRILGDIALSFVELGVYSAARDAYMVLSATAQEQYVRWAATLNLLDISSQTGTETLFELYRRQLSDQQLPPRMATAYQLVVGTGYRRFHQYERASEHLERARVLAGEHGFNQYLFEAEQALMELKSPLPPARHRATLSLDTEEVAMAIQQLREVASAT
jgi:tetratricopeptide (TPR) repeat protein